MVSAVMAHLLVIGGDGLAGVVRWRGHLRPRPLGEDGEEAGDVRGDLPGVLGLRSRPRRGCQTFAGAAIVFLRDCRLLRRCFTEDLTGGSSPLRASGLRSRNPTDDAGPSLISSLASPSQGSPLSLASTRQFFLGIVNLWLLPARITSWSTVFPTSQAIEHSKKPWHSPSTISPSMHEGLAELPAASYPATERRDITHCGAAPSCL